VTNGRSPTDRSYWLPVAVLPARPRFPIITTERWGPDAAEEAA
jgi:hypothetical protein